MQLLTVVGAIAVLSNVVSAVPQPSERIEQIQEKRWGWPWSTDSGKGGHGGNGGGSWGGDDDDDDDSNTSIRSLLPFTHPHLVAEETGSSTTVSGTSFSTLVSSSSIARSSVANVLISGGGGLSTTVSIISTVTDPILSATPVVINTFPSPPTSSSPTSTLSATLIIDNTSLTLCSALPTSIITVTESCTSTEWITVIESGSWTTTPLPSTNPVSTSWTTTPLPSGSPSGSPSGVPGTGGNSTGIWTVTPVETSSRVWTTSAGNASVTSSFSSAVETGTGTSVSAGPSASGNSSSNIDSRDFNSGIYFNYSSFSTTTIPYSSSLSSLSFSTPISSSSSLSIPALPISTGTTDLHPSTTIAFTTTVTTLQASGTPNPAAVHCGLHGLPVGDYFLAEFVEDKAGVAVTLQGCWEFCDGVYGIDKGCVSYSFYPEPGTGAPRCDLFGGSVAQSLDSIIPSVPNVWFDLECGDPSLRA
ncbi:uncharacterized protein Bfra_007209ia [Botrytis fragariae]|uniref:Apple domain-containing protein n=1 Tax=Botrytis fragariae TaxID=1964551 RepID=A0A8H6AIA9_9HELO|nr:uncharacterized protein Bfra_007209ia [Botrytis fragariae]KAF5868014.1 hypothetical protein Bfra_007209ia [Botrytis fragariae]